MQDKENFDEFQRRRAARIAKARQLFTQRPANMKSSASAVHHKAADRELVTTVGEIIALLQERRSGVLSDRAPGAGEMTEGVKLMIQAAERLNAERHPRK